MTHRIAKNFRPETPSLTRSVRWCTRLSTRVRPGSWRCCKIDMLSLPSRKLAWRFLPSYLLPYGPGRPETRACHQHGTHYIGTMTPCRQGLGKAMGLPPHPSNRAAVHEAKHVQRVFCWFVLPFISRCLRHTMLQICVDSRSDCLASCLCCKDVR